MDSNLLVDGNFNLAVASSLRLDVYDTAITATMTVNGTAVFAGSLEAAVEDVSLLTSSDTFTVLTASQITGQFANVPSGGRVDAYGDPNGDPIGSFLVTYDNTTLVLSDFQPAGDAAKGGNRRPAGAGWRGDRRPIEETSRRSSLRCRNFLFEPGDAKLCPWLT